ncbi:ring canal kelch homolog isoform X1 [Metopolophium dirhodum]|uniref:ring canal kelch homolog isoform X1 n=1 Tax=Metopolophium dirhodum TaxID=44670 RepID=UPI00298F403F|nr:ring canal kelch homolog isoform X1 [Metopolophium dirhodum]
MLDNMSVNEMDVLQTSSYCESDLKQVLKSNASEPTNFRNSYHPVKILEGLQSLRKNKVLCDIKLETDDGTIVFGHKNILVAASPYFCSMFSTFNESDKDIVNMREFDSHVLQLLLDYIYTGEIMVTKENVQVLLSAANILQLDYVKIICAEFLQTQLEPSNCIGIKAFADLHNCTKLMSSSEAFIHKKFLEVVKCDEFLYLSCEKVIQLISCDDLAVPFEEKVFECVINWVKYDLNSRKDFLPELMEHIRLPLIASKPDILKNIAEEPLLKNNPKCKCYFHKYVIIINIICVLFIIIILYSGNKFVLEASSFHLQKSVQHFTISHSVRYKPRQFGGLKKVILMFYWFDTFPKCYTEWYDPATNIRRSAPEMNDCRRKAGVGVIRDQFVFVIGGVNSSSSKYVSMLDVFSPLPCWIPMVNMLVSRAYLGVGILDDNIYAVGGFNGFVPVNNAEVFDINIQKWKMIASMTTNRSLFGIGVLNGRLYAVGGFDGYDSLKSVESYEPSLDTWTPVGELSVCRDSFSIGVMDGVMYAIGGIDGSENLKSVEAYRPSDGVWYFIADMHLCRKNSGVVVLDGLLYVIGGESEESVVNTIEVYNPKTNTWSMGTLPRNDIDVTDAKVYSGVVINRPPHFITN